MDIPKKKLKINFNLEKKDKQLFSPIELIEEDRSHFEIPELMRSDYEKMAKVFKMKKEGRK